MPYKQLNQRRPIMMKTVQLRLFVLCLVLIFLDTAMAFINLPVIDKGAIHLKPSQVWSLVVDHHDEISAIDDISARWIEPALHPVYNFQVEFTATFSEYAPHLRGKNKRVSCRFQLPDYYYPSAHINVYACGNEDFNLKSQRNSATLQSLGIDKDSRAMVRLSSPPAFDYSPYPQSPILIHGDEVTPHITPHHIRNLFLGRYHEDILGITEISTYDDQNKFHYNNYYMPSTVRQSPLFFTARFHLNALHIAGKNNRVSCILGMPASYYSPSANLVAYGCGNEDIYFQGDEIFGRYNIGASCWELGVPTTQ